MKTAERRIKDLQIEHEIECEYDFLNLVVILQPRMSQS